jgi:SAM-dependent methyltransferase
MSEQKLLSRFLKSQYGIKWTDISSKLRSSLLAELESVPCNLCGRDEFQPVARRDKYRLPLTTVMCKGCGLLYLNPRPTAVAYGKFYQEGGQQDSIYHRRVELDAVEDLLTFYYGPDFVMDHEKRAALARFMADEGVDARRKKQRSDGKRAKETAAPNGKHILPELNYYALQIYEAAKEFVPMGGRVFEAGASMGKMLQPWKELHNCEATGIEPKIEAVREAKIRRGLDLMQGFANDPKIPKNAYDLVLNIRTINHMLDPLGDLRNAWHWLKAGGILLVDVQDAIVETGYQGFERYSIEIDHPYMFTLNTMTTFLNKAGFEVVRGDVVEYRPRSWDGTPEKKQIRVIAQKSTAPVEIKWSTYTTERLALARARVTYRVRANWARSRARLRGCKRLLTRLRPFPASADPTS